MSCPFCGQPAEAQWCGFCRACWVRLDLDVVRWLTATYRPNRRLQRRAYRAAAVAAVGHLRTI